MILNIKEERKKKTSTMHSSHTITACIGEKETKEHCIYCCFSCAFFRCVLISYEIYTNTNAACMQNEKLKYTTVQKSKLIE